MGNILTIYLSASYSYKVQILLALKKYLEWAFKITFCSEGVAIGQQ